MTRTLVALALFLSLGLPAWCGPRDQLRSAIGSLREVSTSMGEDEKDFDELLAQLDQASSQVATAEEQLKALTVLLATHTARVKQLGERYTKVIELAQRLKKDLEWSATMNYVLGGTAVVAVVAAIVGFAR